MKLAWAMAQMRMLGPDPLADGYKKVRSFSEWSCHGSRPFQVLFIDMNLGPVGFLDVGMNSMAFSHR